MLLGNFFKGIIQKAKGEHIYQAGRDLYISNYNISSSLPEIDKAYCRRDDESDIKEKLKTINVLCIYGISGIGKTAISIAVANDLKDNFENVFFIKGEDISAEFENIVCNKMSYSENLEIVLTKQKILLVIDNLTKDIDKILNKFSNMNIGDSKIIITSQTSKYVANNNRILLLAPQREVCKKILCSNLNYMICEEDLDFIFKNVSSNPLLLKIINRLLINGDKELSELKQNINDIVCYEDIDKDDIVARRLIGVISDIYVKEVKILKWLNSTYCDIGLLKTMIKSAPFDALKNRAIFDNLESINVYTVKIHDIILKAINYHVEFTEDDNRKYTKIFIKYFRYTPETDKYFNALFMHKHKVQKLYYNNIEWGETLYLFLKCSFDSEIDFNVIDKLSVDSIGNIKYDRVQYYKYISVIEYLERKALRIKIVSSNQRSYKELLEFSIDKINGFLNNETIDSKLKIDLYHHLGKFYLKLNDKESKKIAKTLFEKVLNEDHKYYASMLQLLRIYLKEDIQIAKKYIKEILDSYYFKNEPIDTTIVLATIQELRRKGLEKEFEVYIIENYDHFKQLILNSSNFYFDHPFKTFVDIGKNLTYKYPSLYLEIAKNIPIKINDGITDDNMLFSIGEYYKDLYKCKTVKNKELLDEAEKCYTRISKITDYQLRMFSQIYTLKKDNNKALNILDKIKNKDDLFVQYEYSKIFSDDSIDMSKLKNALSYIDKAIELLNESKRFGNFKSMLYAQKGKVLCLLKDTKWREYYKEAIDSCVDEKYLNDLNKEYEELCMYFK